MELTSLVIPLLLAAVAAWGAARRVDVYAALTDGAMDGLRVVLRICPNLIALLLLSGTVAQLTKEYFEKEKV